jgi:chlorobactene glucosyltransferase
MPMIGQFFYQQQIAILAFICVLFLIVLFNALTIKSLGSSSQSNLYPMVSVLIPARNEAQNIEECVYSVLNQDYSSYEVIVLDDESQDATPEILKRLSDGNSNLKLISGQPLPPGWVGKNWACYQLSQAAQGELILFVDADTLHHPSMLTEAVSTLVTTRADLLSGLPRQELKTLGEHLILPVLPWAILSFFPIRMFQHVPFSFMSIAVGQFILCRRTAYLRIGGHAAVRGSLIEDIALARLFKKNDLKWEFVNLKGRVNCRMYQNFREIIDGLSKNMFAVFGNSLPVFLFIWLWLAIVFITPALSLILYIFDASIPGYSPALTLVTVGISTLLWLISLWYFRMPLLQTAAYPLTIALASLIAFRSAWLHFTQRSVSWKGREVKTSQNQVKS